MKDRSYALDFIGVALIGLSYKIAGKRGAAIAVTMLTFGGMGTLANAHRMGNLNLNPSRNRRGF